MNQSKELVNKPRVIITDFLAESGCEREVLPGVEVDALLSLIGHPPTLADLMRVVGERPATVLITWYEMFFDPPTLAALSRAGVVGIVRAGVGFDNIDLMEGQSCGHHGLQCARLRHRRSGRSYHGATLMVVLATSLICSQNRSS